MEIECEFFGSSSGEYYACKVTKASITKPNVDIVSFKGIHEPGKRNDDVTAFYFYNALVEYFPRNLQKIFPSLKNLRILNCGLKEISRGDLIGLEMLEWLDLGDNLLKSLPDDLLSNMPNLKGVGLGLNQIEFASSKLIEPIVNNQLELFSLMKNTSIDEYYLRGHKYGCKTIQELMAKIDEKCKRPTPTTQTRPETISNTSQSGSNRCYDTSEREIFKGINDFRLQGRFTDFVIAVCQKELPVNKNVLAAQSSVLAEMFEVKTNGRSASKLEISDMSAEAVEAFLDYLYERKLPAPLNAMEVFKIAAKYEVAKLKTLCEKIIQENLDVSNAFEIFKLACGPHKSEELKVAAFGKLQEKFGGELDDDLMNDPDELQEIVETKIVLDDLMTKSRAKRQRLV